MFGLHPKSNEPQVPVERSGTFADAPLAYSAEFRPVTGGIEVVVSIVNQGESPIGLSGVKVDCRLDQHRLGLNDLLFPHVADPNHIRLDQFEMAEGRFHLPDIGHTAEISTLVYVDYLRDGRQEREQIPLKVETRSFKKR